MMYYDHQYLIWLYFDFSLIENSIYDKPIYETWWSPYKLCTCHTLDPHSSRVKNHPTMSYSTLVDGHWPSGSSNCSCQLHQPLRTKMQEVCINSTRTRSPPPRPWSSNLLHAPKATLYRSCYNKYACPNAHTLVSFVLFLKRCTPSYILHTRAFGTYLLFGERYLPCKKDYKVMVFYM